MRLIDADAIPAVSADPYEEAAFRDTIADMPTIDPVKHGKWIEYPIADGMNQCSVCGVLRFGDSNYCPNCGAKMRGENDE